MGGTVAKFAFVPPDPIKPKQPFELLKTANNHQIPVQFFPTQLKKGKPTIIFSHGNGEDLAMNERWMDHLSRSLDVNMVSYDYSGYGMSKTHDDKKIEFPSEAFVFNDVQAVYDHVTRNKEIDSRDILFMGRSLGSGPTCEMGKRLSDQGIPFRGCIIQSGLLSCVRVAMMTQSKISLPIDIFINRDKIDSINAPIFIIHGEKDEVVGFEHGKGLYELIKEKDSGRYSPWWILTAGHNDIEHGQGLRDFIKWSQENEIKAMKRQKSSFFGRWLQEKPKSEESSSL
ncbi:putative serine protease family S09X [Planoprotostelium fungivorum]|uniref:Putative serine protease family S09X n=1 Tax=Planoprotostelium fungivorum TaxID=1890364 RepID=A0A2P6P0Y6_9EUKA|nr:putative serine protease family S09X [Planoprotostelium fungivorum]